MTEAKQQESQHKATLVHQSSFILTCFKEFCAAVIASNYQQILLRFP